VSASSYSFTLLVFALLFFAFLMDACLQCTGDLTKALRGLVGGNRVEGMVLDLARVGLDAPPKLALPSGPGGSSILSHSGGEGSFLNLFLNA
jgi:hypothetical protein